MPAESSAVCYVCVLPEDVTMNREMVAASGLPVPGSPGGLLGICHVHGNKGAKISVGLRVVAPPLGLCG